MRTSIQYKCHTQQLRLHKIYFFAVVHEPFIETCRLGLEGTGGVVFNSTFVSNTTSCDNTRDTFVNVLPVELHFEFTFVFRIPGMKDPPEQHDYVYDYHFGIVASKVAMLYYSRTGGMVKKMEFLSCMIL